jgi:hypothetical protein
VTLLIIESLHGAVLASLSIAWPNPAVVARGSRCAAALLFVSFAITGCANYKSAQQSPQTQDVPAIALSTTSFNFNTVVIGQSATQTLTVKNTGNAPLQVSALAISNSQFSYTGPSVPRTVLPNNSISYTLTFAPNSSGSASATFTITSNASPVTSLVSLSGSGEKAFANLVITPASISFGNLQLQAKNTQNVTLQNTGDINLTIQGVTLVGGGFGYVDLSPGFSLAPTQKLTFQVWFSPKATGPASGTLSFLSPNLSSAETMQLTGAGITSSNPTPPPTTTQRTVHLAWDASTSQVAGYRVYRSQSAGSSYALLTGSLVNELLYYDSTVSVGATYYYVVTAVDSSGNESVQSNQATAVIPST